MSRDRDLAINILLGILLVSAVLLPFLLACYALQALAHGVKYFLPAIPHSDYIVLFGILLVPSLTSGVVRLRQRRWKDAFLWLAILPVFLSSWFTGVHSVLSYRGFPVWPLFLALAISSEGDLPRPHFLFLASAVGVVVAVNAGLFGSGPFARIIAACLEFALFGWFVIRMREEADGPKNPDPKAPLSATHA